MIFPLFGFKGYVWFAIVMVLALIAGVVFGAAEYAVYRYLARRIDIALRRRAPSSSQT